MKLAVTAALMLVASMAAQPASAQPVQITGTVNHAAGTPEKPETVSVTLQLVLPAPAGSSSVDMTQAMAATSQSLYDIINRECDVLSAVLKGNCRLTRLNVGGNYSDPNINAPPYFNRQNGTPSVNATATAIFEIEMKATAAESPAAPAAPKP